MTIWEITHPRMNDVAPLVRTAEDMQNPHFQKQFGGDGSELQWLKRPKLTVKVEKGKKKQKPRSDVSPFTAPGLVFNGKVRDALGDFLRKFGQVLEIEVDDGVEYYYNVTQIVPCVDESRSEKYPEGSIAKAVFDGSKLPIEPVVFIDPLMRGSIYVNDSAKAELERLIQRADITGMAFEQVGGY
ncbi:hypothetical protein [Dyella nitratireducens]|uniref:Uncharacterized protein n=1 Tax=Dyella nitratireducens TaxID=1849580 RepID=A0ABQ1FIN1_9GAMM|nr:hypothetical protein [Dyella nitratireducens]GGA17100.1 hypothetical protein GCM10010981_01030 [Dyella nitratireducens]GLQ44836.1 hypothetical protein GCM10007902_46860 [Dyella nitratireducens]